MINSIRAGASRKLDSFARPWFKKSSILYFGFWILENKSLVWIHLYSLILERCWERLYSHCLFQYILIWLLEVLGDIRFLLLIVQWYRVYQFHFYHHTMLPKQLHLHLYVVFYKNWPHQKDVVHINYILYQGINCFPSRSIWSPDSLVEGQ